MKNNYSIAAFLLFLALFSVRGQAQNYTVTVPIESFSSGAVQAGDVDPGLPSQGLNSVTFFTVPFGGQPICYLSNGMRFDRSCSSTASTSGGGNCDYGWVGYQVGANTCQNRWAEFSNCSNDGQNPSNHDPGWSYGYLLPGVGSTSNYEMSGNFFMAAMELPNVGQSWQSMPLVCSPTGSRPEFLWQHTYTDPAPQGGQSYYVTLDLGDMAYNSPSLLVNSGGFVLQNPNACRFSAIVKVFSLANLAQVLAQTPPIPVSQLTTVTTPVFTGSAAAGGFVVRVELTATSNPTPRLASTAYAPSSNSSNNYPTPNIAYVALDNVNLVSDRTCATVAPPQVQGDIACVVAGGAGASLVLRVTDAASRPNTTYRWYDGGGTLVSASNAPNITFSTPLLTSSQVYYVVAVENGVCISAQVPIRADIITKPSSSPVVLANFEPFQSAGPLLYGRTPLTLSRLSAADSYVMPEPGCTVTSGSCSISPSTTPATGGSFEGYQLANSAAATFAPSSTLWAVLRACGGGGSNVTCDPWLWGYNFGGGLGGGSPRTMNNNYFMGAVELDWIGSGDANHGPTTRRNVSNAGTTYIWEQDQGSSSYSSYAAGTMLRVSLNAIDLTNGWSENQRGHHLINPNRCAFTCEIKVLSAYDGHLITSSTSLSNGAVAATGQTSIMTPYFPVSDAQNGTKVQVVLHPLSNADYFLPNGPPANINDPYGPRSTNPAPINQIQNIAYFGIDDITLTSDQPCLLPTPLASDVSSCERNAVSFQASYSGGALPGGISYQWFAVPPGPGTPSPGTPSPGTPIAGATSSSYTPQVPGTNVSLPHTDTYEVGLMKGSDVMSARKLVQVTWYPNPANPNPSQSFTPATPVRNVAVWPGTTFAPVVGYTYLWNWGDGETSTTLPHTYREAGLYTISCTITDGLHGCGPSTYTYPAISVSDILCEVNVPATTQAAQTPQESPMYQSTVSGVFSFIGTPTCTQTNITFDCLSGQPDANRDSRLAVAASAAPLAPAEVVTGPGTGYGLTGQSVTDNPFLTGSGYLQPETSHAYRAATSTQINTTAGRFAPRPFTWGLSFRNRPRAWVPAGQATRFSPNGEAVEEKDALGVPSTVRFGYLGNALPYLTGKNASYNSISFDSFETVDKSASSPVFENQSSIDVSQAEVTDAYAHAGKQSLHLKGSYQLTLPAMAGVPADWVRSPQGVRVLTWIRVATPATAKAQSTQQWAPTSMPLYAQVLTTNASGQSSAAATTYPLEIVGQSGEWSLCQVTIAASAFNFAATPVSTAIRLGYSRTSDQVWFDDVRVQPAKAQVTAYVYDPVTLKLLASFDDQHFGLFYQYDSEGRLVRKLVETERGRKTVQETLYNVPTKPRP